MILQKLPNYFFSGRRYTRHFPNFFSGRHIKERPSQNSERKIRWDLNSGSGGAQNESDGPTEGKKYPKLEVLKRVPESTIRGNCNGEIVHIKGGLTREISICVLELLCPGIECIRRSSIVRVCNSVIFFTASTIRNSFS